MGYVNILGYDDIRGGLPRYLCYSIVVVWLMGYLIGDVIKGELEVLRTTQDGVWSVGWWIGEQAWVDQATC
ncbi:hypothetical protein ccbrp13_47740 [Ktedonobacteria bacterium brp13]|nr:hypothetical protein ccbrp13_47740 [Ktedonobacteria bacterium brp13]